MLRTSMFALLVSVIVTVTAGSSRAQTPFELIPVKDAFRRLCSEFESLRDVEFGSSMSCSFLDIIHFNKRDESRRGPDHIIDRSLVAVRFGDSFQEIDIGTLNYQGKLIQSLWPEGWAPTDTVNQNYLRGPIVGVARSSSAYYFAFAPDNKVACGKRRFNYFCDGQKGSRLDLSLGSTFYRFILVEIPLVGSTDKFRVLFRRDMPRSGDPDEWKEQIFPETWGVVTTRDKVAGLRNDTLFSDKLAGPEQQKGVFSDEEADLQSVIRDLRLIGTLGQQGYASSPEERYLEAQKSLARICQNPKAKDLGARLRLEHLSPHNYIIPWILSSSEDQIPAAKVSGEMFEQAMRCLDPRDPGVQTAWYEHYVDIGGPKERFQIIRPDGSSLVFVGLGMSWVIDPSLRGAVSSKQFKIFRCSTSVGQISWIERMPSCSAVKLSQIAGSDSNSLRDVLFHKKKFIKKRAKKLGILDVDQWKSLANNSRSLDRDTNGAIEKLAFQLIYVPFRYGTDFKWDEDSDPGRTIYLLLHDLDR